ncbi:hypothetical protein EMEDMD4_730027 [Sinorhizobium medicae]|uniref:Uncharacterized protein n=1 Tax=Sinorhizobium medicae TaxID=110321 RepID=A0A508X4X8_9HYPH|nr:hypothetical protein EMEDMD4_730027 [Sinorhizobium medicae]
MPRQVSRRKQIAVLRSSPKLKRGAVLTTEMAQQTPADVPCTGFQTDGTVALIGSFREASEFTKNLG